MHRLKQIGKLIRRYKTSTSLTLLSLVICFLGIIILTLYVSYEKSFDGFHKNGDQVYKMSTKTYGAALPLSMGSDFILGSIAEIEAITPVAFESGKITTSQIKSTCNYPASMIYANNSFFDIFTFQLLVGDQSTALKEPNTVVISETFSKKLFGSGDPLGELVLVNEKAFKVTGVMQDFPENSSFQAECILSSLSLGDHLTDWNNWSYSVFVKLHRGVDPELIAAKIDKLPMLADHVKALISSLPNQHFFHLTPLKEIHFLFDPHYQTANLLMVNILILLIGILCLMGAFNFINFITSQAPLRSKAHSVLQILGGNRLSSIGLITLESVLLSVAALSIGILIHYLSFLSIESFFGIKGLGFSGRYIFLLGFFLFAIAFGVLVGLYPAYYITSSPVSLAIKGNAHFSGKGKTIRNLLVTTQFVLTIALISAAFVIEKQLNYWRNFDIGIDKEHVVYLSTTPQLKDHYQAFANELMKDGSILDYTYSQFIPGAVDMVWGRKVDGQQITLTSWPVDNKFLDFFKVKIAEGRSFSQWSKSDVNTFVINKKAAEKFGWKKPLEMKIPGFGFDGQIIGVAENFNFSSLKDDIQPMLFWLAEYRKDNLLLRIKPGNYSETFDFIKFTARHFDGENIINIKFLDDALNKLYQREEKMARFIEFVSIWCILLAATGLLGLILFICHDSIKEIGIRKVNGASTSEVVTMLNKDIVIWVSAAFIIATPIAYYAMNLWLENFAYKTELSWWIFALAGLLALGIALLTVSWQSWKAATRNPVEALRYE